MHNSGESEIHLNLAILCVQQHYARVCLFFLCFSLIMQDCFLAFLTHQFMLCVYKRLMCICVHSVYRSIIKELSDCSQAVDDADAAEFFFISYCFRI